MQILLLMEYQVMNLKQRPQTHKQAPCAKKASPPICQHKSNVTITRNKSTATSDVLISATWVTCPVSVDIGLRRPKVQGWEHWFIFWSGTELCLTVFMSLVICRWEYSTQRKKGFTIITTTLKGNMLKKTEKILSRSYRSMGRLVKEVRIKAAISTPVLGSLE